jgi:hypothetical protein
MCVIFHELTEGNSDSTEFSTRYSEFNSPFEQPDPRNWHRTKTYEMFRTSRRHENDVLKDGLLTNPTLPTNLNLDPTTMQRIQRQIDLGHQQDPAAVITYAMMLLDLEEDWIGCPRTLAPDEHALLH